jgi:hypothetical protein
MAMLKHCHGLEAAQAMAKYANGTEADSAALGARIDLLRHQEG